MIVVHERLTGTPVFEIHIPGDSHRFIAGPEERKWSVVNMNTGDYAHFRLKEKRFKLDAASEKSFEQPIQQYTTGRGRIDNYPSDLRPDIDIDSPDQKVKRAAILEGLTDSKPIATVSQLPPWGGPITSQTAPDLSMLPPPPDETWVICFHCHGRSSPTKYCSNCGVNRDEY